MQLSSSHRVSANVCFGGLFLGFIFKLILEYSTAREARVGHHVRAAISPAASSTASIQLEQNLDCIRALHSATATITGIIGKTVET
jgi:putative effector of murein hydrolase